MEIFKKLQGYKSTISLILLSIALLLSAFGIPVPDKVLELLGLAFGASFVDKVNRGNKQVKDLKNLVEEKK